MSGNLTCKQLVALISEYFDGLLSPDLQSRFETHVAGCGNCAAYLDQLRFTKQAVGELREEHIEASAREALLAAFRAWKAQPASGA